jgi:hypothetical protein
MIPIIGIAVGLLITAAVFSPVGKPTPIGQAIFTPSIYNVAVSTTPIWVEDIITPNDMRRQGLKVEDPVIIDIQPLRR